MKQTHTLFSSNSDSSSDEEHRGLGECISIRGTLAPNCTLVYTNTNARILALCSDSLMPPACDCSAVLLRDRKIVSPGVLLED